MSRALAACVVILVLPSSSFAAGTVSRSTPTSSPAYTNAAAADVVVTDAPDGTGGVVVTIAEPGISITGTPNGCTDNGDSVACTFAPDDDPSVNATLSAQADSFDASASTLATVTVFGGNGDDELIGGNDTQNRFGNDIGDSLFPGEGTAHVVAGDGADQVGLSDDGADVVDLGAGDDRLITIYTGPDPAADALAGGPGTDQYWARYSTSTFTDFTIDLAAGTAADSAGASAPDPISGFENLRTDEGNDTLLGDGGPNELLGGAGDDRLDGRLGSDRLFGQADDDRLEAQDGVADRADGGPGTDECLLDQLDQDAECETRTLANLTPFGVILPDVTAPTCTASSVARPRARRLARRGLAVTLDCDEAGSITARLLGRIRRLGRAAGAARAGDIELARRNAALDATGNAKLRLRVGRRYRRLLLRGTRLRLALTVVDTAGNRARLPTRRLRLR